MLYPKNEFITGCAVYLITHSLWSNQFCSKVTAKIMLHALFLPLGYSLLLILVHLFQSEDFYPPEHFQSKLGHLVTEK